MENKKIWVPLIYKGNDFGGIFIISEDGEIKNRSTKNVLRGFWENRTYYSIISYDGRSYRIKIGEAQLESKLLRTVMDRPRKDTYDIKSKEIFNDAQLEEIVRIFKLLQKGDY